MESRACPLGARQADARICRNKLESFSSPQYV